MGHVLGNEPGLLEVLCDSALNKLSASLGNHFGRDYRNKVYGMASDMMNYFQKLLYAEMKGLIIICEAHHARNETAPVAQYIQSYWQPRLLKQVELFVTQMERFSINSEIGYF